MTDQPVITDFFVCIGAQKAGTTWLARMLARHPDVFMTPVKEIHYFDHIAGITRHLSDRRRWARWRKHYQRLWTQWRRWPELRGRGAWYRGYMSNPIDDRWYASLFNQRREFKFAGEATPEYALIGVEGFAHMKRLAPDMRVLYIMRNPVERAWSQLLHLCRREGLRPNQLRPEELIARARAPVFASHGDYIAVLDALDRVFRPEQVRIDFFEQIHADRDGALERICGFIGLDHDPAWFGETERRFNRSDPAPMPAEVRQYFRDEYAGMVGELEARLGNMPEGWGADFPSSAPKAGHKAKPSLSA
jgi:hypothetical protein